MCDGESRPIVLMLTEGRTSADCGAVQLPMLPRPTRTLIENKWLRLPPIGLIAARATLDMAKVHNGL